MTEAGGCPEEGILGIADRDSDPGLMVPQGCLSRPSEASDNDRIFMALFASCWKTIFPV